MSALPQARDEPHCPRCGCRIGFIPTVATALQGRRSLTCPGCGCRLRYPFLPTWVRAGLAFLAVSLLLAGTLAAWWFGLPRWLLEIPLVLGVGTVLVFSHAVWWWNCGVLEEKPAAKAPPASTRETDDAPAGR